MIKRILFFAKWLIPLFFLLAGLFLINTVPGHSFLGVISLCVCGVICVYFTLALLHSRFPRTIAVLRNVLTGILCVGLVLFAVTEIFILCAATGTPEENCDYLLVLGCKVNGSAPSFSLQDRIDAAYNYLSSHPGTVAVLTGGKGEDEDISEAMCIYTELVSRGINVNRLWLEENATSTWENLTFSLKLIEERTGGKPQSVGILSSEYHLFRAGLFAKHLGVQPIGIPAATQNPTSKINYFLREVGGVWHYLVLGGTYHD